MRVESAAPYFADKVARLQQRPQNADSFAAKAYKGSQITLARNEQPQRDEEQQERAGDAHPRPPLQRLEIFELNTEAVDELPPPAHNRNASAGNAVVHEEFGNVADVVVDGNSPHQFVIFRRRVG